MGEPPASDDRRDPTQETDPIDSSPPANQHRFVRGDRLADRYRVERFLGQGGMGEVYEAHDEELSIPVALKTLRPGIGADRGSARWLKREVLLARSVAHPHVCRVYDLGRHEDGANTLWFLTMELLRGETLLERIRREGRLSPTLALPLVEQIAAGLGAAHLSGIVHGDFKSANVMLVPSSNAVRAVLMDFGLARMAEASAAAAAGSVLVLKDLAGTPAYMAPEQMRGMVGPASDIYALGVVLYEMVTGKLPFAGKTPLELAVQRTTEEAPSPRREVPELDKRWEAVILRCLARESVDRFAEAAQVVGALRDGFPPDSIDSPTTVLWPSYALPPERDTFWGREHDMDQLAKRFTAGSRLVTLVGTAGMGKTRLALHYGWQSRESWPGGVWFCDLTETRSLNGIVSAVRGALDVPLGPGDPVEQLGRAIASRGRCLVMLDNFEPVVGHADETVGVWLKLASEARFMVMSRERLGLRGEDLHRVEPLAIESGVELFVERARRQRASFDPQGRERESVREVVRLVEGMPLAIELAAARVRMMTVGQVVERLRERLRVLGGGEKGRHGSLRAAIEESWDLLKPWERAAWAQCSVFEGGFTLEAAETIVDLSAWADSPWIVDVIQSLVDKSLLRTWAPEVGGGSTPELRFGMFASLQEYARERLAEEASADEVPAERVVEERHGRWCARYGTEEALESIHGREGGWQELQRELENLDGACRSAVARGDGQTATATYAAMCEVLLLQGPLQPAVERGRDVLGLPLRIEDRARVLIRLGAVERYSGRVAEARVHYESALSISREVGERRSEGLAHSGLGNLHITQGRVQEALVHYEAALAIHRMNGNRRSEGTVLGHLGNLHRGQGRTEVARLHYEEALAVHREANDRRSEGIVLGNLGILHLEQGRMEEARSHYEGALAINRAVGNAMLEGLVLSNLGNLHRAQGRIEVAHAHYETALARARGVGDRGTEGRVLCNLGNLFFEQGRLEEARDRYTAALAIHRALDDRRAEGTLLGNLGNVHLAEGCVEEAQVNYQAALAMHRSLGHRRDEGLDLANLARLYWKRGEIAEARDALAKGEAILREVGDPIELAKLLCTRAALESKSGDPDAATATLREIEALVGETGAVPESELGQQLAKLRQGIVPKP